MMMHTNGGKEEMLRHLLNDQQQQHRWAAFSCLFYYCWEPLAAAFTLKNNKNSVYTKAGHTFQWVFSEF